jgi:D-3-phosphoglycerate dehydrogenase
MGTWRVIITDGLEGAGIDILSKEAQVDDRKGISAEDLLKEISNYDALIVRSRTKVTPQIIEAGKNLKVIGRAGVGVDNIDLAAAKEKGVAVVNSPSATTTAVAEMAMAVIFGMARELPRADAAMKRGEWIKKELMGVELNGKTLGSIGFGRIGSLVCQMAAGVGMKVIAFDLFPVPNAKEILGSDLMSLDEVIKNSDFITIHTPLTDETRGMINAEAFSKMKDGVRILCTARGKIIDEDALLEALNSGKVAGAALDVYSVEPPTNKELVNHPKMIATPHIAGQTKEAQTRAAIDIGTEILAALKGENLRWKIV